MKISLTTLEEKIVNNLKGCDEFEGYPQSCVEQIASEIKEDTKVVRGAIASLVKKEVVSVEKLVSGCPAFVLLINSKVVRGTIASLVKKEVVSVEKLISGCPAFVLLINSEI